MVNNPLDSTIKAQIRDALAFQKNPSEFLMNRSKGSIRRAKRGLELLKNPTAQSESIFSQISQKQPKQTKQQIKTTKQTKIQTKSVKAIKTKKPKRLRFKSEIVKTKKRQLKTIGNAVEREYNFIFDFGRGVNSKTLFADYNNIEKVIFSKINKIQKFLFDKKNYCYFKSEVIFEGKEKQEFRFNFTTESMICSKQNIKDILIQMLDKISLTALESELIIKVIDCSLYIVGRK
jgi:hypothetical protein